MSLSGRFYATSPLGFESLLAQELVNMGASTVSEAKAGIVFEGDLALAYRACLWSRLANRILMPISSFPANPTPKHRHILKLLRSYDRGESWSAIRTIEESNDPNIEFSYPALIQDSRGKIHLVYSYLRKSIRHATFTMRWLNENTEDNVPSP